MRPMTDAEQAIAQGALSIVPVVINSMGRSYPGIRARLARIDARSVAEMAVCKAAQTYDPAKSQVTTYFSSAIRNALLKEVAKNQRLRYDSPLRVPLVLVERAAPGGLQPALKAAVSLLPVSARRLIVSRYYHSLSIREMAELYACNQKTVRSRLRLAVSLLHRLLETVPSPPR